MIQARAYEYLIFGLIKDHFSATFGYRVVSGLIDNQARAQGLCCAGPELIPGLRARA